MDSDEDEVWVRTPFDPVAFKRFREDPKMQALVERILNDDSTIEELQVMAQPEGMPHPDDDDAFIQWVSEQGMLSTIPDCGPKAVVDRLIKLGIMDEPNPGRLNTDVAMDAFEASKAWVIRKRDEEASDDG